jgi:hypothetical protein
MGGVGLCPPGPSAHREDAKNNTRSSRAGDPSLAGPYRLDQHVVLFTELDSPWIPTIDFSIRLPHRPRWLTCCASGQNAKRTTGPIRFWLTENPRKSI